MKVVWLEEAAKDLREVGNYIAEENPSIAYRVLAKIKSAADLLQRNPEMGRLGRVGKTRELLVPGLPYILPYYIKNGEVRILAVMHTSRK